MRSSLLKQLGTIKHLLIVFSVVCFLLGLVFFVIGAKPVLGFMGFEIILLCVLYKYTINNAKSEATLIFGQKKLIIKERDKRGNTCYTGFDINKARINELNIGEDKSLEVSKEKLRNAKEIIFTHDLKSIANCSVYIITVPTPVDNNNKPDMGPLISASEMIGKLISSGDIIIYESTVYPGATEEICVPILEECSNLKYNVDFSCGYSPERINPGDKKIH